MEKLLHVFIGTAKVGTLTAGEGGDHAFAYAAGWLNGPAPIPLSLSLALQTEPFSPAASKAFFRTSCRRDSCATTSPASIGFLPMTTSAWPSIRAIPGSRLKKGPHATGR